MSMVHVPSDDYLHLLKTHSTRRPFFSSKKKALCEQQSPLVSQSTVGGTANQLQLVLLIP